jgi:dolichol-phosphate mannosyltransferase
MPSQRPRIHRTPPRIAVVVPCYRVRSHLASLLKAIGPEVSLIYCVDDACPEHSGELACELSAGDPRIRVILHEHNLGVGGAVVTGYREAIEDGAEIIVKLDGDGQMDPTCIRDMVVPIVRHQADYVKGNRFFRPEGLRAMPVLRIVGNAGLSFLFKLSTGYWDLFDPTNGYTAIHSAVARTLPLGKLHRRYFFETDLLFRLNTLRAVVAEVPMDARYADEHSSLSVLRVLCTFPFYHTCNFLKRLFYGYFLRGFSIASVNLIAGAAMLGFGVVFGLLQWIRGALTSHLASPGTVMLAALPVILGIQLLLNFVSFDMASVPRDPLHRKL